MFRVQWCGTQITLFIWFTYIYYMSLMLFLSIATSGVSAEVISSRFNNTVTRAECSLVLLLLSSCDNLDLFHLSSWQASVCVSLLPPPLSACSTRDQIHGLACASAQFLVALPVLFSVSLFISGVLHKWNPIVYHTSVWNHTFAAHHTFLESILSRVLSHWVN